MHSLNTIKQQNKSNAKKLIDLTIKNGGVSFNNELEAINYENGFAVGTWDILKTTNLEALEKELNRIMNGEGTNLYRNSKLNTKNGLFYGLWIDENKVAHLDECVLIGEYYQAVQYGKDKDQKAIYDFKNGIEINLKGGN